ncbi:phage head morphogenesis protein, SPP1 gp7 family [Hartmannibacter diazotrophicus]|uniref:Phage head morphogenesis protein, SPP1 gp7 family n=1 Tax=Hartmannibacter diazotrophicus TaxID=1482074 RepID=A0A2C9D670_9HYPH|nr:phage minor head protein [Hartmannibacter diazotrophicus]SON55807.1 phage head morphogenesis protein, SPP1 gp7 family [Hartmannibacter diazotrophicus]
MAEVKRGFGPPPEVMQYLQDRGFKPAFSYQDVWGEEYAHAFSVAKVTELELGKAFQDSIAKVRAAGGAEEDWRPLMLAELQRLGWWGPRLVADPTGREPAAMVDFTSARRLRTIWWGNTASARAAGQWQRAQRSKRGLPYFLYMRTTSVEPRQQHLVWVGVILPVDDPFWDTHFPPNGWHCSCWLRQISRRESERLLAQEPDPDTIGYTTEAPEIGPPREFRNRRTGEVTEVPAGIDPAWAQNPGKTRATTLLQNLETRLGEAPETVATEKLQELWRDPFIRVAPLLPKTPTVYLPAGVSKPLQELLGARSPVAGITAAAVANKLRDHADHLDQDEFANLPETLATGRIVNEGRPKARSVIASIGAAIWKAVVLISDNGFLRVNTFHRIREEERDRLLRKEGRLKGKEP